MYTEVDVPISYNPKIYNERQEISCRRVYCRRDGLSPRWPHTFLSAEMPRFCDNLYVAAAAWPFTILVMSVIQPRDEVVRLSVCLSVARVDAWLAFDRGHHCSVMQSSIDRGVAYRINRLHIRRITERNNKCIWISWPNGQQRPGKQTIFQPVKEQLEWMRRWHRAAHCFISVQHSDRPASDSTPRRLRLRSANLNRLTVPRCRLRTYGCRAVYHAGPTVWNSLPWT